MEKVRKSKIFCRGICKIWQRKKQKCIDCGVYICGICSFIYNKRIYCINCCLKNIDIVRDLKEEYYSMVIQLDELKKKKEDKIILENEVPV